VSASDGDGAGDPTMKISELADAAGVPVATVRHYLREGLLPEGRKTSRNMAYYPAATVDRIRLIKLLQEERFMPLKVIRELLEREGGDPEAVRSLLAEADRGIDRALARERERSPAAEVSERFAVPLEVLERLAEVGILSPASDGYTPADVRIVEAIARFRAGGYDERIGFTVYDAARFLEPLQALARREVELLSEKLVGRFEPDRAAELIAAGIDPLADLIAAMNAKLITAEIESHRTGSPR
jgi:DNA-binding transcriptional MerR regulator